MNDEAIEAAAKALFAADPNRAGSWEARSERVRNDFRRRVKAALTAINKAGFVVVPREPTALMRNAGSGAIYDWSGDTQPGEVWAAMIAASEEQGNG